MEIEFFWKLIECIDRDTLEQGNGEGAVVPLVDKLSTLEIKQIESFHEILAKLLFDIDGKKYGSSVKFVEELQEGR